MESPAKKEERTKVEKYIKENQYTWTYEDILYEYFKWKLNCYIPFTAKKVINACIDDTCKPYEPYNQ